MVKGKRILVVDDDPQLQRLLQLALKREGYDVKVVSTGEEAIASVLTFQPDLILMDVMMPDMDGYEATKRIRRMPQGRDIPVIFLSALTQVEAKVKGLRVGGTDYVTKPVNLPELLARIEAHLGLTLPPLGQLVTVMGARSGVGTTTFVVNLALAVQEKSPSSKIMIVDWRRPVGDVAIFLGLLEPPSLDMLLPGVTRVDEEALSQIVTEYVPGISVVAGSADPAAAQHMDMERMSDVLETALVMADYVIVDVGPFLDWTEPPLVGKETGLNFCLITPEVTSVKRVLFLLQQEIGEEREINYILNREGMPGGIATRQIENNLRIYMAGKLPNEPELITRAMNVGDPVFRMAPKSKYARAIRSIVREYFV